ncbi:MAG: alpha/beta hydrolase [Acidimicrobiia bacterium]|nr:alpha/beta hydrolase [Acidimicrobiia bacterium]
MSDRPTVLVQTGSMYRIETIPTRDVPIAVQIWHDPALDPTLCAREGRAVLLAHPTGFHGVAWRPVAEYLVAHGFAVWSFDFRAHGDSAWHGDPAGITWQGFADDAVAVVDWLALPPGELLGVGISKGGASLIRVENRRPGTFRALWLWEPIIMPPPPDDFDREAHATQGNPMSEAARRRRSTFDNRAQALDNYAGKPPLGALDRRALAAYVEYGFADRDDGTVELKCQPEHESAVYRPYPDSDAWHALADLTVPTMILGGALSNTINPEQAALLAQRSPMAQGVGYDGVGHFGPFEDPDRFGAAIADWAKSVGP